MKNLSLFYRKRNSGNFSIEQIFSGLELFFHKDFRVNRIELPNYSSGIWNRLCNIFLANKNQAQVNHITGDVNYLALGLHRKTTVLTIHDCGYMKTSNKLKKWILGLFWIRIPSRRVNSITAVSEVAKHEFIHYSGIKPERVRVIYNYVAPQFIPAPYKIDGVFKILHIGTKANKNLKNLILSLKEVSCYLYIVGKLTSSQEKLLKTNNISYENEVDVSTPRLIELYHQCNMLSFISTHEGFGMPIIEAQATGRPVVTSNLSSMPEVAGKGALLVNPNDINDIKLKILSIMKNGSLRDNLIELGFENVKRFKKEVIAEQYLNLYHEILNARA